MDINDIASDIHQIARDKGWWDSPIKIDGMNLKQWYQLIMEYRSRIQYCIANPQSSGDMECSHDDEYITLNVDKILKILTAFLDLIQISRQRNIPEVLALIHSEVSEALEAHRNDVHDNTNSLGAELADIIIRTLDAARGWGIDIEAEIKAKHEYNQGRSYRHGGKSA